MNAGIDMSIGDFVFEFDNTILDFNPDMIMEIYRKSLTGFDIVSRTNRSTGVIVVSVYNKTDDTKITKNNGMLIVQGLKPC